MFFKILCVLVPWKKVASASVRLKSKPNWKDVPILFTHQSVINGFFYHFYSNGINMHRCQYITVQSFDDYEREAKTYVKIKPVYRIQL